jgi:hypothetical protein
VDFRHIDLGRHRTGAFRPGDKGLRWGTVFVTESTISLRKTRASLSDKNSVIFLHLSDQSTSQRRQ